MRRHLNIPEYGLHKQLGTVSMFHFFTNVRLAIQHYIIDSYPHFSNAFTKCMVSFYGYVNHEAIFYSLRTNTNPLTSIHYLCNVILSCVYKYSSLTSHLPHKSPILRIMLHRPLTILLYQIHCPIDISCYIKLNTLLLFHHS